MRTAKVLGLFAATVVLLIGTASVASAHVTVDPDSAPQGAGDQVLTFRVPNEEQSANTVKVDMQFPTDHPIASVDVETPANGWTAQVTTTHLATPITTDDGTFTDVVSEVVWSGGTIPPGQYGEFKVLAQGLPSGVTAISFPTVQTYSDGTVVSWIDPTVQGQPAPDHPAPVLTLTAAAGDNSASTSSAATAPSVITATVVKKETSGLAVAAIIVSVIALIVAIVLGVRRRHDKHAGLTSHPDHTRVEMPAVPGTGRCRRLDLMMRPAL